MKDAILGFIGLTVVALCAIFFHQNLHVVVTISLTIWSWLWTKKEPSASPLRSIQFHLGSILISACLTLTYEFTLFTIDQYTTSSLSGKWEYHIYVFAWLYSTRLIFATISAGKKTVQKGSFEFGTGLRISQEAKVSKERIQKTLLHGHQLVLGASGSGKTYSVLEPQLAMAIKRNERVFIIDPKGDSSFRDSVWTYCSLNSRSDDFRYFSMSLPKMSNQFNPFGDCNANEIKDMIIAATDWSEPHYKKIAELEIIKAIRRLNGNTKINITNILNALPNKKELLGIRADLELLLHSSFGNLINNPNAPSIFDSYMQNKVIFISLDSQAYPQESIQLGRIFLGAILSLSNRIQTTIKEDNRKKTTVVVDEFGSFLTPAFINFVNKARASKFRLILATQSIGDLEQYSPEMRKQVIDSITNKIVMRMSDPESIEYCSKLFGTYETVERTTAMEESLLWESSTGRYSEREVEKFTVHPKDIRGLDTGLGYLMTQSPFSIFRCSFGPREATNKLEYNPININQNDSSEAWEKQEESISKYGTKNDSLIDSAEVL